MAVAAAWLWMACVMAVPTLMASPRIPEVPTLRHIGVADGLPSSDVRGLAFDPDGYLWIATIDGLARYDGVGMQVWRHVPGDARSLPGNYMTVVHRSEEHTSELQSLMRISYAVFCLKKKNNRE